MAKLYEQAGEVKLASGKVVIGPYFGRILESLYECMIPDGGVLPIPVRETNSVAFLAKYLRDQEPIGRFGIKLLFIVFDLAPLIFIGRFSRFVNLTPQEKELYLWDWYASRIYYRRMVTVLLKTLLGMGYYNDPKVLQAIGFKVPCQEGVAK
jgi:hypothetical protein